MKLRLTRLGALSLLAVLPFPACDCDSVAVIPEAQIELLDEEGASHKDADPWLTVGFGDVDDGSSAERTLRIRNIGGAPLDIENACLVSVATFDEAIAEGTPCLQTSETPFGFQNLAGERVTPSDALDVTITFAPRQGGPAQYFLRIASNAGLEPVVAVELSGRGTAGRLCADNPILDFGEVYIGSEKTLQVTLDNCGLRPVTVDTYRLLANPDEVFTVLTNGATPEAALIGSLEPGETLVLDVIFAPEQVRSYRDTLAGQAQLTTAAPFAAGYTLLFVGDGRTPPSCRVNVVPQTVQFGAVAANTTATQNLIIQSVGECACEVTGITPPDPSDAGFALASTPSLPVTLRGTRGCEGDPAGAQDLSNLLQVPLEYTSPDRQNPEVDNATMTVTTTDANEPTRTVNLEANGGGTPFCQLDVTPEGGGLFGVLPVVGRYGVVEFGRVTVYFEKRLPIELKNVGNTTCTINGVEWNEEANTLANEFGLEFEDGTPVPVGNASPVTIQPGQVQRYVAVFAPTGTLDSDLFSVFSFGSYSAALEPSCGLFGPNNRCNGVSFSTTDTVTEGDGVVNGTFSIGFSATPVEPAVEVIPGDIDFGLVTLDCGSPLRRVTLYNTGSGDLTVGEPYAVPQTTPATFEVAANAPSFPHTVPPGGSLAIDVRFYARTLDVVNGELVIPTVEGGQQGPPIGVPLRGEGTLLTEQTDIFDQFTDPKVDVLWVVDDSGSMSPYQTRLAGNFPQFFSASNVEDADYHIAVTTTLTKGDPFCVTNCTEHEKSGYYTSCQGNDRYLTPSSSGPQQQFQCNVKVSDANNVNPSRPVSDSAEAGLQAAKNFLEAPNIDDPAINGGFLRDDAKLHVIVVSDEPDQSDGSTDLYVDFFRNLKGFRNDSLVAFSAIAAPEGGCQIDAQTTAAGDARYSDVVSALNGRFESICTDDWTTLMANLGLDSLGLKVEFFLSRAADAATLSVCVRSGSPTATCTPVAQTSDGAASGYFYDPAANSIVFNPASIPSRGSRIQVDYETYCY